MKILILFFLGFIAILSTFYIISPTEFQLSSFNQVFAQSEDKNKNFDDAKTTYSSDTTTKENNGENKNFDEAILSQSSDTSTIANQNNKTSYIGRLSPSEFPKIHPAIIQILENANPKAMAKIYGASIENDHL